MAKNAWIAMAVNVALIMTVVGSAWLVLDTGIGQTYDVVTGDTGNITTETNATFGGSVGFSDRAITLGAVLTILVGVGAISAAGAGNNKFMRDMLRYYPLLIGVLGLVEFSAVTTDFVNGSYDFDVYSDGQNALHIFVIGSVIGAAANLLNMRK
jgi:hypothetical protein